MAKGSNVTEEQCEGRNAKAHERIDKVTEKVNKIVGGIIAISFIFALFVGGIFYHMNFRFSRIEKALEKIQKTITPDYKVKFNN